MTDHGGFIKMDDESDARPGSVVDVLGLGLGLGLGRDARR